MVAYKDAVQRDGKAVQAQLAEFHMNALENTFVREDTATAGKSLRLYNGLTASQGRGEQKGWSGETRTRWAQTPLVDRDRGGRGHSGYRWRGHILTQDNRGVESVDSWVT